MAVLISRTCATYFSKDGNKRDGIEKKLGWTTDCCNIFEAIRGQDFINFQLFLYIV